MDDREIPRVPASLPAIEAETLKIGFGMAGERPVGALLRTLARSKGKGRFLELGTGTGLSTAWILDGMSPDSTLLTLDNDPLLLDVPVGRGIVRSPGNDPGGVDARKSEGVCDLGNQERVAPEEPDLFPENSVMIGAPGHIPNGLRRLSLPMGQEFNVHCLLPSERGIPSLPGDLSRRTIMKKELSQSR